jgi:hypothetical protein
VRRIRVRDGVAKHVAGGGGGRALHKRVTDRGVGRSLQIWDVWELDLLGRSIGVEGGSGGGAREGGGGGDGRGVRI